VHQLENKVLIQIPLKFKGEKLVVPIARYDFCQWLFLWSFLIHYIIYVYYEIVINVNMQATYLKNRTGDDNTYSIRQRSALKYRRQHFTCRLLPQYDRSFPESSSVFICNYKIDLQSGDKLTTEFQINIPDNSSVLASCTNDSVFKYLRSVFFL